MLIYWLSKASVCPRCKQYTMDYYNISDNTRTCVGCKEGFELHVDIKRWIEEGHCILINDVELEEFILKIF